MMAGTHHVFSARGKLYKIFQFTSQLFVDLHCNIQQQQQQQQQHNFMTKSHVSSAFSASRRVCSPSARLPYSKMILQFRLHLLPSIFPLAEDYANIYLPRCLFITLVINKHRWGSSTTCNQHPQYKSKVCYSVGVYCILRYVTAWVFIAFYPKESHYTLLEKVFLYATTLSTVSIGSRNLYREDFSILKDCLHRMYRITLIEPSVKYPSS